MSHDCACSTCKRACTYVPGFYHFGEVEKAAALKGMTVKDFFNEYCVVNWWQGSGVESDVFLISPATMSSERGGMANYDPRGRCVHFNDEGLCDIHAAKPGECRAYIHGKQKDAENQHKAAAMSWNTPEAQEWVTALFGREPFAMEDDGSLSFWGLL